ncbi:hypothetical protein ACHAWF_003109 [Thalassiosira exigua]
MISSLLLVVHLLPPLLLLSNGAWSFAAPPSLARRGPSRPSRSQRSPSAVPPAALPSLSSVEDVNGTLAVDGTADPDFAWDNVLATRRLEELEALDLLPDLRPPPPTTKAVAAAVAAEDSTSSHEAKRSELKRELVRAAITGFSSDPSSLPPSSAAASATAAGPERTAEDVMKELERLDPLPIPRPATDPTLDARWSFVFTGVPTIGMRLITLLSRISTNLPFEILDFRDVALRVYDRRNKAEALVEVKVCGAWDLLLEVKTALRRPTEDDFRDGCEEYEGEEGTLLLEQFRGVRLNGVRIPTPKSWRSTRTLEITYLDEDVLIARTSGGEPHLLLRKSPPGCGPLEDGMSVDEEEVPEECDLDGEGGGLTEFFREAAELYGDLAARCLVDRDLGREESRRMGKEVDEEEGMVSRSRRRYGERQPEWWKSLAGGIDLGRQWGVGDD